MKGSSKQFARYLEFECNDEYLQPAFHRDDLSKFLAHQNKKLDRCIQAREPPVDKQPKPPKQNDKGDSTAKLVPLSGVIINDLVARLGQDARNCVSNILEANIVDDPRVLKAFEGFYDCYETLPAIFCSFMPAEAVFLWQINKRCPVHTDISAQMILDTASKTSATSPHISLLLLAKIVPAEDEEILSTKLLDDNQLLVKFRSRENELVFTLYNVEDFIETAMVNPFNHKVLANDLYSFKLVLKGCKNSDKPAYALDISLWQRRAFNEDIMIQKVTLEQYPVILSAIRTEFFNVFRTSQGVIVIADTENSTAIAWKETTFSAANYDIGFGAVKLIRQRPNSILLSTRNDCLINYELEFWNFPEIKLHNTSSPVPNEILNLVAEFNSMGLTSKKLTIHSLDPKNADFLKMSFLVSKVKFPRVNSGLVKQNAPTCVPTTNQQDVKEEKIEQSLVDKIYKMKSKLGFTDDPKKWLEGMLKEIRGTISCRKKDMIEYKRLIEEYQREMNQRLYKYFRVEPEPLVEPIRPEGVTKEILNLYHEIKTEKMRIKKERESEKIKKDREKTKVVRQAV